MGIKFIKKKKSEVAAANTLADLKTTVDKDGNVEIVFYNDNQPAAEEGSRGFRVDMLGLRTCK